jgi:hypothetical protein
LAIRVGNKRQHSHGLNAKKVGAPARPLDANQIFEKNGGSAESAWDATQARDIGMSTHH